jgi:tetratricopeptide (TPR) repeat protein
MSSLQAGGTIAISAISGMGGIGKTELALQYAYKHLDLQTYPGSVCWLGARQEVGTQIVSFAQTHLGLAPSDDLELLEKVTVCWQQWRDGDVLVVFDDVQSYAEIQPFLPPGRSRFKVLLTTRLTLQSPVQPFEIKVLSEEKAIELLRAIVPDERIDQDLATAKQICKWLGYLPLGLELAGRYLVWDEDVTLSVLWQRLKEKRTDAIALKQTYPGMTASDGVAAAFELSWQTLSPLAQQLASLLSLFALAEIPWTLVEACLPEVDAEALQRLRTNELVGLHLLERTGQGMYQLHQLLREFFAAKREQMVEADVMKQILCRVLVTVGQQIPQRPTLKIIEHVKPAIPHLKEAAINLTPWLTDKALITPGTQLAWFYAGQSAYAEALRWSQACLTAAEVRFGVNHPAVSTSLNNLALLYHAQGRYGEAEPMFLKALAIAEQHFDADHPAVSTSLNNLAELYSAQGRYEEAEPLFLRGLAIAEQHFDADHPAVAMRLNNLANLYRTQGRYEKAEPLFLKALAIAEQHFSADHPDVAIVLNSLALLYYTQRRYEKAEPLFLKALAIAEQHFSADHPAVSTKLGNLALLYDAQGRYGEAESLYLRGLVILFKKLGEDHPITRTGKRNFLGFLQAVMEAGETGQLSNHPATQDLLRQMRDGERLRDEK